MTCEFYHSPVGVLKIVSDGQAIIEISVSEPAEAVGDLLTHKAVQQLKEYFEGRRKSFSLPVKPSGTEFQKKIWQTLTAIPYGEAISYGQVAELSGNKKACRAVGNAVGRNPILIVIPCHRVKAADGIGGFSAGIKVKEFLIELENIKK